MSWQETYLDRFYRSRPGWQDGTSEFHAMCRKWIPPGGRILEIGAGPTNPTSDALAQIGELHGLDPDPAVRANGALASSHVLQGDHFPLATASFDAAVSNYVLEHIERPLEHLKEVARILRPGGSYLFRTPNRFHYVALVSAATPHRFHELVANRARHQTEAAHEPYPTFYRLNTAGAIRSRAAEVGLGVLDLRYVEKEPSYGMGSRVLFRLFMAYERAVNASDRLSHLRANLFGALTLPSGRT